MPPTLAAATTTTCGRRSRRKLSVEILLKEIDPLAAGGDNITRVARKAPHDCRADHAAMTCNEDSFAAEVEHTERSGMIIHRGHSAFAQTV